MKSTTGKFGKTPHQPSLWTRADALKVHADDPTTTQPLAVSYTHLTLPTICSV